MASYYPTALPTGFGSVSRQSTTSESYASASSQQLTLFLDMRGWLKDAVEQAIQPLITEITTLKGKLEETDNRVRKLEKEVELKDEKAQQVQAQSAIVKWRREGCMIQGLEVFPGRAPPTKTKAKVAYNCYDPKCSFQNRLSPLDTCRLHDEKIGYSGNTTKTLLSISEIIIQKCVRKQDRK